MGVNQSWRVVPKVDAHFANDFDQFDFDNPIAAGYGGRAYYEDLHARRRAYHTGAWANFGTRLDRHDGLTFSRRPFQKRHRGAHVPTPLLENDGGVALKASPATSSGSSAYIALQIVAAEPRFRRIYFVGLDMVGAKKFDGAKGYTGLGKKVPTDVGAWSNCEKHDALWKMVPLDVLERVLVIEPSATKVLRCVPWPWGNA